MSNLMNLSANSIAVKEITEECFNEKYHNLDEMKAKLKEEVRVYSYADKQEKIELKFEFYEFTLFDNFNNIILICAKQEKLFGTYYYYMILIFEKGKNKKLLDSFFYALNDTITDELPFEFSVQN